MYLVRPPYLLKRLYPKTVWRMPADDNTVYLTFDDGPVPGVTARVLDMLKEYDARATFFCVGQNVMKHKDLYERMITEGHTAGNHTYNHLNAWTTPAEKYLDNIKQCAEAVSSHLFRPPYGKLTRRIYSAVSKDHEIIMWDVLSGDYDAKTSPEKCLRNVISYTRPGSLVVFHDSVKAERNLMYTLPRVLEHYSNKGFTFSAL
jgi:peptidoglycan-N-acetylglucosamine deacetylase